jgi:hypothetical protein
MTQRALRETTPHACAEEIVRTALELLPDADDGLASIENDRTTVDVAVSNMAHASLSGVVEYRLRDGPAALASAVSAGRKFSVVHLDPPW